ncbi:hypothetical protein WH50_07175 [Pokkaliibacter plantistimulans]|uniref:Sulfotransferase domain-containing protein n=1 Tax=Pokkaliibacter plantistimulans TaxID=1635171 RepID=A0ABX5M355_9GAMM|nr:sulfotransferase domain-containing protein [Pokkaliibacter plantistimulans]PXF31978.1 hypothetical protein WH50_07175 [Pokkaliibacter plantistimulans]
MKFDTLYLHVGWSKTGTSAIQSALQNNKDLLLEKGILYPQSIKWNDHSHHHFAFAFKKIHGYQPEYDIDQAISLLEEELESSDSKNAIISSELSPVYFNNEKFLRFYTKNFKQAKIILTVRQQSELLISLFNQLIKDPNVRYGSTLFTLAFSNAAWLNYAQGADRWAQHVGKENIIAIRYSDHVVDDFFNIFKIDSIQNESSSSIINPSLPTRALAVIQHRCRQAANPVEYAKMRDNILSIIPNIPTEHDRYFLFTPAEQKAFDDFFVGSNNRLAKEYMNEPTLFSGKKYKPVGMIPPGFRIEDYIK